MVAFSRERALSASHLEARISTVIKAASTKTVRTIMAMIVKERTRVNPCLVWRCSGGVDRTLAKRLVFGNLLIPGRSGGRREFFDDALFNAPNHNHPSIARSG